MDGALRPDSRRLSLSSRVLQVEMGANGRMGRFLMNLMMAAGGYPRTVIPLPERRTYMATLERASVEEDIEPLADFLAGLVEKRLQDEPPPGVPVRPK